MCWVPLAEAMERRPKETSVVLVHAAAQPRHKLLRSRIRFHFHSVMKLHWIVSPRLLPLLTSVAGRVPQGGWNFFLLLLLLLCPFTPLDVDLLVKSSLPLLKRFNKGLLSFAPRTPLGVILCIYSLHLSPIRPLPFHGCIHFRIIPPPLSLPLLFRTFHFSRLTWHLRILLHIRTLFDVLHRLLHSLDGSNRTSAHPSSLLRVVLFLLV
mmetsp:Transcript_48663/g.116711  ORF Transcript_48663/g.116711 Transcript_48663/m.116711 type:complete len:209 (+) Transcript_48663:597-1223(+)